jgi:hypothetical protein
MTGNFQSLVVKAAPVKASERLPQILSLAVDFRE